jgi:hypothetical protein
MQRAEWFSVIWLVGPGDDPKDNVSVSDDCDMSKLLFPILQYSKFRVQDESHDDALAYHWTSRDLV